MGKIIGLAFPEQGKKRKGGGGRSTKAELLARCAELGVEPPEDATNDVLGRLVREAEADLEPEEADES